MLSNTCHYKCVHHLHQPEGLTTHLFWTAPAVFLRKKNLPTSAITRRVDSSVWYRSTSLPTAVHGPSKQTTPNGCLINNPTSKSGRGATARPLRGVAVATALSGRNSSLSLSHTLPELSCHLVGTCIHKCGVTQHVTGGGLQLLGGEADAAALAVLAQNHDLRRHHHGVSHGVSVTDSLESFQNGTQHWQVIRQLKSISMPNEFPRCGERSRWGNYQEP